VSRGGKRRFDWYAAWRAEVSQAATFRRRSASPFWPASNAALADMHRSRPDPVGRRHRRGYRRGLALPATRRPRPAESSFFLVGDKPGSLCWGYGRKRANSLLASTLPARADTDGPSIAVLPAAPLPRGPADGRGARHDPVVAHPAGAMPLLLLLLLAGAYLAARWLQPLPRPRSHCTKVPPAPPAHCRSRSPAAEKASLATESARAQRAGDEEMDDIEGELKKRVADCRPPEIQREPPKPPQTADGAARPAPPAAPPNLSRPPRAPGDNRCACPRRRPTTIPSCRAAGEPNPFATRRYSASPGISSYCFDASGRGELEWRRGRLACRNAWPGAVRGSNLALRDTDTTCNGRLATGTPTSSRASAAPTMSPTAAATRRGAFGPTRGP